jgi:hypothetical protein
MSKTPKDLFQRYVTPPSRLHNAVQSLARQEGWIPPWDREEQQSQKKAAGKKSGVIRERRTKLRRYIVGAAYWGLKGTSNNCHQSSGAPNLPTNDSALFSFRFRAVHPKDVRDCQLRQLFEVP